MGRNRFRDYEASLIAELIARDAPFYEASVAPERIADLSQFQIDMGLNKEPVGFLDVVAADFAPQWT